jgi:hypothetical protein
MMTLNLVTKAQHFLAEPVQVARKFNAQMAPCKSDDLIGYDSDTFATRGIS